MAYILQRKEVIILYNNMLFYRKSLNRNMHYIEKNRDTVVSVIYVLNVNCQNNSLFQNISLFQYIIRKIEVRTC